MHLWPHNVYMEIISPHIVTSTDYHGADYQHTVWLSAKEARDRIVDGRLLSKSQGEARNYARLWDTFKDREQSQGGMDTKAWEERELVKLEIEKQQI